MTEPETSAIDLADVVVLIQGGHAKVGRQLGSLGSRSCRMKDTILPPAARF
jgi:hypothetical protein